MGVNFLTSSNAVSILTGSSKAGLSSIKCDGSGRGYPQLMHGFAHKPEPSLLLLGDQQQIKVVACPRNRAGFCQADSIIVQRFQNR